MSNQCEHGQLARVCYTCELEARVAELDRLNTHLAMESHALQGRMAELEALVLDVHYGKTPDCACRIMQPITRTENEWIAEAERLCPAIPQEDA